MIKTKFPTLWKCPTCDAVYQDLHKAIPSDAQSANVYCHKCNTHYDMKPSTMFGWILPSVTKRVLRS